MDNNITSITTKFTAKQWLSVADEITALMRSNKKPVLVKDVSITFSQGNGSPNGRVVLNTNDEGNPRRVYDFNDNGTLRRHR